MTNDLNATSTLRRNDSLVAANGGRPAYDVCHQGTDDVVGQIKLGPDDQWYIVGAESDPWAMIADAARIVMSRA